MNDSNLRRTAIAFLALTAPVGGEVAAQAVVPAQMTQTGVVELPRLRELSGVAASRTHAGVLWTHNDSGDDPNIYAIDMTGSLLAVFDVRRARARDWEDIAIGPCPNEEGDCLYIADTGDNNRRRNSVDIYFVPEPDPASGSTDSVVQTDRSHRLRFRYPGGERYDVEALGVAPDGEIMLVTKGRRSNRGILHFRIPADEVLDGETRAELVAQLPITPIRHLGRWVTGAAISPSGNRAVVRTYTELFLFDRTADGVLVPSPPTCWLGAAEPQGEAVDFIGEDTMVLVSEALRGRAGTIFLATCAED